MKGMTRAQNNKSKYFTTGATQGQEGKLRQLLAEKQLLEHWIMNSRTLEGAREKGVDTEHSTRGWRGDCFRQWQQIQSKVLSKLLCN